MVQNVCEHHEWIEATQTTTGGNNFTFTQCKKCGTVFSYGKNPIEPDLYNEDDGDNDDYDEGCEFCNNIYCGGSCQDDDD
jgi:hypothetical protein